MYTRLIPTLLALALCGPALGEPLIYEGQLSGLPDGADSVALRFTLHDAAEAGREVWDSGPMDVSVLDGRFVAELEDGPSGPLAAQHFGASRWLQVTVLPVAGEPVALWPRQRIGRVPWALEAVETAVRGLKPEKPGSSCQDVLESGGKQSGVYWVTHPDTGVPVELYCDQATLGGGWALLYNSVLGVDTTFFWDLSYADGDHIARFGEPSMGENFYDGSLYLPANEDHYANREFLDTVEDLRGRQLTAAWVSARTFDPTDMTFVEVTPVQVDVGYMAWVERHFAAGWSSSDRDEDDHDDVNCAIRYANVAQHYLSCWVMNLGADSIAADPPDEYTGPHVSDSVVDALGLAHDGRPGATRVRRISRFVRW